MSKDDDKKDEAPVQAGYGGCAPPPPEPVTAPSGVPAWWVNEPNVSSSSEPTEDDCAELNRWQGEMADKHPAIYAAWIDSIQDAIATEEDPNAHPKVLEARALAAFVNARLDNKSEQ